MQQDNLSLQIQEIPAADAPMELLLLADPSESKICSYLSKSRCFVASVRGIIVGTCVVQPLKTGVYELMSIAVHPDHQKSGKGTTLLKWAREHLATSLPFTKSRVFGSQALIEIIS